MSRDPYPHVFLMRAFDLAFCEQVTWRLCKTVRWSQLFLPHQPQNTLFCVLVLLLALGVISSVCFLQM